MTADENLRLIAGLGNPGRKYARTRHNAGFRAVDLLAAKLGAAFTRRKFKGLYVSAEYRPAATQAGGPVGEENVRRLLLVKPQTYMNLSGETVQGFAGWFKVPRKALLVVVDDVALPPGMLRLRGRGSDGGHKGLRDVARVLGGGDFARLRIGVGGREAGNESDGESLTNRVLGRFTAGEEELLATALEHAAEACLCWAVEGIETAMNRFNILRPPEGKEPRRVV